MAIRPLTNSIKSFLGARELSFTDYLKSIRTRFREDSLFRNSIYLLASTITMSLFGFVFWILTTNIYEPAEIGLATAIISATTLLATFSMFGFNTGLLRYLSNSEKKNETINTVMIVVSLLTLIVSTVYVIGIGYFAPEFKILKEVPTYGILFVAFMLIVSINMLTDSIFIAYRAAKYNLIVYIAFGIAKIILPLLLIRFALNGVLLAYIGSVIIAFACTFILLIKKFNFRFSFLVNRAILKDMTKFSLGNYLSNFISSFPTLALPTIIIATLGAAQSAYFYIASTIAALLYGIPQAISQSLFAEGSHSSDNMKLFVVKASKLIGSILVIGIVAFLVFGKFVLHIFGKDYAENSSLLLSIMAVTAIFTAVNVVCSTVLRVHHRIAALIVISIGYVIVTMGLAYLLISDGIIGAGIALLLGQAFMSLEYAILFLFVRQKPMPVASLAPAHTETEQY
jgi:O-antigen/teichoic acid export membrane protein